MRFLIVAETAALSIVLGSTPSARSPRRHASADRASSFSASRLSSSAGGTCSNARGVGAAASDRGTTRSSSGAYRGRAPPADAEAGAPATRPSATWPSASGTSRRAARAAAPNARRMSRPLCLASHAASRGGRPRSSGRNGRSPSPGASAKACSSSRAGSASASSASSRSSSSASSPSSASRRAAARIASFPERGGMARLTRASPARQALTRGARKNAPRTFCASSARILSWEREISPSSWRFLVRPL